MGSFSIWHWLIVLAVILIIFGAGKLPRVIGDVAKGIKNFKQGMKEEDKPEEITHPEPVASRPVDGAGQRRRGADPARRRPQGLLTRFRPPAARGRPDRRYRM